MRLHSGGLRATRAQAAGTHVFLRRRQRQQRGLIADGVPDGLFDDFAHRLEPGSGRIRFRDNHRLGDVRLQRISDSSHAIDAAQDIRSGNPSPLVGRRCIVGDGVLDPSLRHRVVIRIHFVPIIRAVRERAKLGDDVRDAFPVVERVFNTRVRVAAVHCF